MEICVDSVESALCAQEGGATRIELCSCLNVGGLTPSLGLLTRVKEVVNIPVFVLIRPRASDFLYSQDELLVMEKDIRLAKDIGGADGIVTGALTSDGLVDIPKMTTLISVAKPLPVTFHRAIDMCRDPLEALDSLLLLGVQRVLTSGQQLSAWNGRNRIREMVEKVKDRITIMPGGGIDADNLEEIIEVSGAREFHASAKIVSESRMTFYNASVSMGSSGDEYRSYVCDSQKVSAMVHILHKVKNQCNN